MAISSPLPISAVAASSFSPASATPPVTVPWSMPPLVVSADRRNPSSWRMRADLTAIEPDLNENKYDRWRTNGVSPVLSMSKLGGASSMTQFVVDIPLQLIEVREKQGAESSEVNGRRYWSSCAAPPGKNLVCIFPQGEIYIKVP